MRDSEAEAAQERRHRRIGEFIDALGSGLTTKGLDNGTLIDLRLRLPTEEDPSVLLIVRATGDAGRVIAFVGAFRPGDALLAWRARLKGSGVKWREDVPWSERG